MTTPTAPTTQVPQTSTPQASAFAAVGPPTTVFGQLPIWWQNLDTKFVYVGIDGSWWDLAGNYAGRQGLSLAPTVGGTMHVPFESLFSEGPYQIGAVYERTDFKKRTVSMSVQVNVGFAPANSFRYRMLEQAWWNAWSPSTTGFFGCYTRTHGWRWLVVQLADAPTTPFTIDPVANDNNFMQWDMHIVAVQPYWAKRIQVSNTFVNPEATSTPLEEVEGILQNFVNQFIGSPLAGQGGTLVPGQDVGVGQLTFFNNGDQPAFPKYIVSAPGIAWIQDGIGGPLVQLPLLFSTDGYVLVDTDPTQRTLFCATDPNDPLLFQILQNSDLINLVFGDITDQGLPVWQRPPYVNFMSQIPPFTQASITVYHTQQGGSITAYCPQHWDKAYA
jgi:hypothetical protein